MNIGQAPNTGVGKKRCPEGRSSTIAVVKRSTSAMAADQATGCREHVPAGGQLYDNEGNPVSDDTARRLLRDGCMIEVPNAGAGSYNAILERLGFTQVKVENQTSSAGDWIFKVRSGLVFQYNRYPYHGFSYTFQKYG